MDQGNAAYRFCSILGSAADSGRSPLAGAAREVVRDTRQGLRIGGGAAKVSRPPG